MHNEEIIEEKKKINYKLDSLKQTNIEKENSLIHDLFFFELEYICENNHTNNMTSNFILYISLKDMKNQKNFNIESFLNTKKLEICSKCNKRQKFQFKFKNCPKILLIYFKEIDESMKLILNNNIDLKDIILMDKNEKSAKYNLIGIIKENGTFSNNDKKVISFSLSPINNLWYDYSNFETAYQKDKNNKSIKFDDIKKDSKMPNLLIYEKEK
jgi:hypothetical protein